MVCFDQYELDYLGRIKFLYVEMSYYKCLKIRHVDLCREHWATSAEVNVKNWPPGKLSNFPQCIIDSKDAAVFRGQQINLTRTCRYILCGAASNSVKLSSSSALFFISLTFMPAASHKSCVRTRQHFANRQQTPRNICTRYKSRHVSDTLLVSFSLLISVMRHDVRCGRAKITLMLVNEVTI